jgi:hypothetical protein
VTSGVDDRLRTHGMHGLNTQTHSNAAFWYLRGLDVRQLPDPPDSHPYFKECRWLDSRGEMTVGALLPRSIVYAGHEATAANYYTKELSAMLTRIVAPPREGVAPTEIDVGARTLTEVAAYRARLYLLDPEQHCIHVFRVSPVPEVLPQPLRLPEKITLTKRTRLCVWEADDGLRILLWDPTKRGFTYLVQDPSTGAVHRRETALRRSNVDPSEVQLGDAFVDSPEGQTTKDTLYFTDLRQGSVHAVRTHALEPAGSSDAEEAVDLVRGGRGLAFGEARESSLARPVSVAVFRFPKLAGTRAALKKAYGDVIGETIAAQRFLVCVDSRSKCVVTVDLRAGNHAMLPLVGSPERPFANSRNLLTMHAAFERVVLADRGALLFGTPDSSNWWVLEPWIPDSSDIGGARIGPHS